MKIISRLREILKFDQRVKLEEERQSEQQVPSSPTVQPPSPVPDSKQDSSAILEGVERAAPQQRRTSTTNRLQRQDQSVREGRCGGGGGLGREGGRGERG